MRWLLPGALALLLLPLVAPSASQDEPSFVHAERRSGDSGLYANWVRTADGDWEVAGTTSFRWGDVTTWVHPDGSSHLVRVLNETVATPDERDVHWQRYVDTRTGLVLATELRQMEGAWNTTNIETTTIDYHVKPLDWTPTITDPRSFEASLEGRPIRFTLRGPGHVRSMEAFSFRNATFGVNTWLAAGVPDPIRVERRDSVVELVEFHRGTEAAGSSIVPRPAAPVRIVAARPWGPEDAEVPVLGTAAEAWQSALDWNKDFRAFMALHPEARAAMGESRTWQTASVDGAGLHSKVTWSFVVVARDTTILLDVESSQSLGGLPGPPAVHLSKYEGSEAPKYTELPASMPMVKDLARSLQRAPSPGTFSDWGWNATEIWVGAAFEKDNSFDVQKPLRDRSYTRMVRLAFDFNGTPVSFTSARAVSSDWGVHFKERPPSDPAPSPASEVPAEPGISYRIGVLPAVGLAALLLASVWKLFSSWMLPFFSRIAASDVARHPVRRRILSALESSPGLNYARLARDLALGFNALDHHLRKLLKADLIRVARQGRYNCYYLVEDKRLPDQVLAVRASGVCQKVLREVQSIPGRSGQEIATLLGLHPSAVSRCLKVLQGAQLVEVRRAGKRIAIYPAPTPTGGAP